MSQAIQKLAIQCGIDIVENDIVQVSLDDLNFFASQLVLECIETIKDEKYDAVNYCPTALLVEEISHKFGIIETA